MKMMIIKLSDSHAAKMAAAIHALQSFSPHVAHALAVTRESLEDFAKAIAEHYLEERVFDLPEFDIEPIDADLNISMNIIWNNLARPKYRYFNNRDRGIASVGDKYPRYTSGFV